MQKRFPGFPPEPVTNFWAYPKALNGWWKALSPSEQKTLDYILRHTWGYQKTADSIAFSQFIKGITKRDGTIVDGGTGIKNKKTLRRALKGLQVKGFIEIIPQQGSANKYKLKINSSQEMGGVPNNGMSPLPKNGRSDPSQSLVLTINNLPINKNNTIPVTQDDKKTSKEEVISLIGYLSGKLGCKFPNYGKQAKYTKSMLDAGYSVDDIKWAINTMLNDKWWAEHSFDMKNVADEIPKLMTRTYKKGGQHG